MTKGAKEINSIEATEIGGLCNLCSKNVEKVEILVGIGR